MLINLAERICVFQGWNVSFNTLTIFLSNIESLTVGWLLTWCINIELNQGEVNYICSFMDLDMAQSDVCFILVCSLIILIGFLFYFVFDLCQVL